MWTKHFNAARQLRVEHPAIENGQAFKATFADFIQDEGG